MTQEANSRNQILSFLKSNSFWIWAAFASFLFAAIFTPAGHFISSDVDELYVQYLALHEKKTLWLNAYKVDLGSDRQLTNAVGQIYSKYSPIYPFISALFTDFLELLKLDRVFLTHQTFLLPGSFLWFLNGFFTYRFFLNQGFKKSMATWGALSLTFGSFALFYGLAWPQNTLEMIWLWQAWCLSLVAKNETTEKKYACVAGALFGLAGCLRVIPFLFFPFLLLNFKHKRSRFLFSMLSALFVFSYFGIQFLKLGTLSQGTYGNEGFSTPWYIGFFGTLLWPGKSLLFFIPVFFLFPIGVFFAFQKFKTQRFFFLALLLIYLGLLPKWWAWMSGADFGPRFQIPLLPWIVFFSLLWIQSSKLKNALFLALSSFGATTAAALMICNPLLTYREMYKTGELTENNEAVSEILRNSPLLPVKITWIDLVFFKSIIRR